MVLSHKRFFTKNILLSMGIVLLLPSCQSFLQKQESKKPFVSTGFSPLPPPVGTEAPFPPGDFTTNPGWVSVFQTFTSDRETSINILRPRLTPLAYHIEEDQGAVTWKSQNKQKVIQTISGPHIHWKVDRIHIKNLDPQKSYRLVIVNKRFKKVIDWRRFKSLDIHKKWVRFIVGSCLSDSHAFEHIRSKIWDQMLTHKADFLMLLGDQVYVDDFDFVPRKKAKEFDLWTRYIDSFRKIPLFQNRNLIPILAVWDDHDYGSNNADKNFPSKKAALKVFSAFFGGEPIKEVYETRKNKEGVYFGFKGFGQKFLLMDDRYFRESNKKKKYGQWGEVQHQWFQQQLKDSKTPVWLANGGQFFVKAKFIPLKNGFKKQINESFTDDQASHFKNLIKDIKEISRPVVFLSGDSHHSEINPIEKEILGYKTYEITSSPIHSFIYRNKKGQKDLPQTPSPIVKIKEHNYIVIDSQISEKNMDFEVFSLGVKQKKPFFQRKLKVSKK